MPLAFAMVFVSLFVFVTGSDALSQVLGFLVFENGISRSRCWPPTACPLIVEAGVFLDVLMVFLLMQSFVYQIHETFESLDVEQLNRLRDDGLRGDAHRPAAGPAPARGPARAGGPAWPRLAGGLHALLALTPVAAAVWLAALASGAR